MKRFLAVLVMLVLMVGVITVPASAESMASKVDTTISINTDGDCSVSMAVTLHLETPDSDLVFPLPGNATNITLNGSSARTTKNGSTIDVNIGNLAENMVGDFTITFGYIIPGAVTVDMDSLLTSGTPLLRLDLPILCGFEYPIQELKIVITLPSAVTYVPSFYSTYQQNSFESNIKPIVNGSMITGASTTGLNDHESVSMAMYVTEVMFPGVSTYVRTGNPEIWPMIGFAVAALLYWLLFLRALPLIRTRTVTPPEGLNAGELGCHLTLAGVDLTMLVMHWAQMGYILIQLDGGRVLLHKRMDMGNERRRFERTVYKSLFGTRRVVDATSSQYARLHQKVARTIPDERDLLRSKSGGMKIFRGLLCISQVFCGICVAMNMTSTLALQILLSLIFGIVGAVSAWQIQEIAYRTHLRGKTRVYIGLMCMLLWIALGFLCGEILIPLCAVLVQFLMSYFAAYGGRRTDVGRHDAGQILGLRSYLKKISKEDVQRIQKSDPDYFFNMAPYALALGIIHPFAKNFGSKKLDQCPYLMTRVHGRRTADEWADMMAQTADLMDARQRRMEYEKWTTIPQKLAPAPKKQKRTRES
ncbi:MAG: DUF2207 domain-containing protein [Oscillospiraceae bacterium]|nr:DUF2207 domain-containing protein [Oscillospiraceae bacterium]